MVLKKNPCEPQKTNKCQIIACEMLSLYGVIGLIIRREKKRRFRDRLDIIYC